MSLLFLLATTTTCSMIPKGNSIHAVHNGCVRALRVSTPVLFIVTPRSACAARDKVIGPGVYITIIIIMTQKNFKICFFSSNTHF